MRSPSPSLFALGGEVGEGFKRGFRRISALRIVWSLSDAGSIPAASTIFIFDSSHSRRRKNTRRKVGPPWRIHRASLRWHGSRSFRSLKDSNGPSKFLSAFLFVRKEVLVEPIDRIGSLFSSAETVMNHEFNETIDREIADECQDLVAWAFVCWRRVGKFRRHTSTQEGTGAGSLPRKIGTASGFESTAYGPQSAPTSDLVP